MVLRHRSWFIHMLGGYDEIILTIFILRCWSWEQYTKLYLIGVNTLGPRQHRRRFADDIFKCIFFNENSCVLIKISLKYVRKGPIDNNPALVQIMAWRRLGDKPFSEPMMVSLSTHTCVTRPQWVNETTNYWFLGHWVTILKPTTCIMWYIKHFNNYIVNCLCGREYAMSELSFESELPRY